MQISAEEKKQIEVAKQQLPSICSSDLTHLETLYTPIKNKLITVSNFSVQNNDNNKITSSTCSLEIVESSV